MTTLSAQLVGSWRLRSREDRDRDGKLLVDPFLGPNPIGFAVFDDAGGFAAQLMKRDRDPGAPPDARNASNNNTGGVAGYDAYFGTYSVDEATGLVTQTLSGAISAADVGRVISRWMHVEGDVLTIKVETSTVEGVDVTRTLIWERA